MSSADLLQVWEAAKATPFSPTVGKDSQFFVASILLSTAFILSGVFLLNRSILTLPALGIPASLAFGFGSVYMICAVGLYIRWNDLTTSTTSSYNTKPLPPDTISLSHTRDMSQSDLPIFNAVSSSARQLFLLLRCISFSPKVQVQITEDGLRFSVEESSVLEGMIFLEKSLFTTFQFNALPPSSASSESSSAADDASTPAFSISLPSLLETLQIFGSSEPKSNPYHRGDTFTGNAFSNQVLGISGSCRLSYEAPGDPLTVVLEESSIRTTCELVTYEPSFTGDIPFARDALALKVIVRASYLFDAIAELSTSNPDRVSLAASQSTFTLAASSTMGSAVVDFHRDCREPFKSTSNTSAINGDGSDNPGAGTGLLETFIVTEGTFSQTYKFSHIAATKKALAAATKVSIRADDQGVLSLQFMIENLEGGGVSFVDFRFVPLVGEEGDEDEAGENDPEEE